MVRQRLFLLVCAGWEIVRFAALFALLTIRPEISAAAAYSALALWFGSAQLVLAGAFAMLALYPLSYANYLPLLRLGKVLSLAPAVLALLNGIAPTAALGTPLLTIVRFAMPFVILVVDSILLLFLLSYRVASEE